MAVMSLATAPAIPLSSSTLNPNAPMFVPLAYRAVEDFSGEWWALVQTSPWFRDYWLRERFHDPQYEEEDDACFSDTHDLALPEADLYFAILEQEEEERRERELVSIGRLKWKELRRRFVPHAPRWYAEKAPKKIVSAKQVSPRTIQQPR